MRSCRISRRIDAESADIIDASRANGICRAFCENASTGRGVRWYVTSPIRSGSGRAPGARCTSISCCGPVSTRTSRPMRRWKSTICLLRTQ
jgi:hypothetical protein